MHYTRLIIRGRVHGVGFRAFVEREAKERGLEGWVRNRRDGSVETMIAGDEIDLKAMIEVCGQGPAIARVDWLDIKDADAQELLKRQPGEKFSVLMTV